MSLNQIKHSGAILRRGLEACEAVGGARLHSTRMRFMLGVCRVMGCGSGAPDQADHVDDTWTMEEIEELQVREGVASGRILKHGGLSLTTTSRLA